MLLFRTSAIVMTLLAGCFQPPDQVLVDGPTLSIEIGTVSETNIVGAELVVTTLLVDPAQTTHADFVAANVGTIDSEHPIGVQGARVRLRAGNGVDDLSDAFAGFTIFIAPENDPSARVALASAVTPARVDVAETELVASKAVYEKLQPILTSPRFIVGVSGPTPLVAGTSVELGLTIELDLAVFNAVRPSSGHF